MKREDLIHAIDTVTPSNALRARVLALPARPRPRLENPLRPILSLGAAGLLCAGVVAVVLALQNMAAPGGDNTGFNALSGGTDASETTAGPETQAPQATDMGDSGLGPMLALPDGILSPDEAISVARQAIKDSYNMDAEDYAVVDEFSYAQPVVYGTAELWEPLRMQDPYAGKMVLFVDLLIPEETGETGDCIWTLQLRMDGSYDKAPEGKLVSEIVINAQSGRILAKKMGSLPGPTPAPTPTPMYPDATAAMQTTYVPGADADSAKRNCVLANECEFSEAVETGGGIDYVINGQTTEGLTEYCDRYYKVSLKNPKKCELDPSVHPDLIFVLVDGLVDKNFVGTAISEEKLNLLISAGEDATQYGVYAKGMLGGATLEFSDNWETFTLTIHNVNPGFRPTSNFTILTRYAPAGGIKYTVADWTSGSDEVQYYALPVSGE